VSGAILVAREADAMTAREAPELAHRDAIFRTIPDSFETESITTSSGTVDLASFGAGTVDLTQLGWVFVQARGGNVTMRRILTGEAPTLTAGQGFTILDGEVEEVYLDPGSTHTKLRVIASANCNLDIHYDSKV
jgi:hypothetical protein